MDLLQLKYFCRIVSCGTVTQAARELHVSQPALSSMLRKLEKDLGGSLFVRDGRGIRLNRRGQIVFSYAQKILQTLSELEEEMQKLDVSTSLSLTIELKAASALMIPIIQAFQKKYPQIQITLIQNTETSSPRNKPDLIITASRKKNVSGIPLLREELVLAVPQNHRLAGKDTAAVKDFQNEDFIMLSKNKVLRQITDEYCRRMHFSPRIVLESDDIGMVKELIRSGFGVSVIPEKSWADLSHKGLKKLHISSCPCIRYILLQQTTEQPNEAASLFVKEIRSLLITEK